VEHHRTKTVVEDVFTTLGVVKNESRVSVLLNETVFTSTGLVLKLNTFTGYALLTGSIAFA
jgi:hypothetical protein